MTLALITTAEGKPAHFTHLSEREQDDFAHKLSEIFPEERHAVRHATRQHWRKKLARFQHIDSMKHVMADFETDATTNMPRIGTSDETTSATSS
ncbi:hypothetical protein AAVH_08100 [Aphelenchoides avenae]|nr:hypothetical protein AAVH_08100 [Aphelenchus avenae]